VIRLRWWLAAFLTSGSLWLLIALLAIAFAGQVGVR
jgi:hypothetical protein